MSVSRGGVHCVVATSVLHITSVSVLTLNRLPVRADEAVFKCQFVMEDSSSVSTNIWLVFVVKKLQVTGLNET